MLGMVLVVEDDAAVVSLFQRTLQKSSFLVRVARNFQEFLDLLPELEAPLVVLLDESFPGGDGAKVAQILRERIPHAKLISTSSWEDKDIPWASDSRLRKPVVLVEMLQKVEELMMA